MWRPLREGPGAVEDDRAVAELFDRTFALGREMDVPLPGAAAYRRLCLGWYLGAGRSDAAVFEVGGSVLGYLLVCVDERAHGRWVRRAFPVAAARMAVAALRVGAAGSTGRRFLWHRLRDLRDVWHPGGSPMPVHVHLNLDRSVRVGRAALEALDRADAAARRVGAAGWYGEVNAPVGRRSAPLGRLGLEVVRVTPNRTLTWVRGEPVERLTVVRRLAPGSSGVAERVADQSARAVAAAQR